MHRKDAVKPSWLGEGTDGTGDQEQQTAGRSEVASSVRGRARSGLHSYQLCLLPYAWKH